MVSSYRLLDSACVNNGPTFGFCEFSVLLIFGVYFCPFLYFVLFCLLFFLKIELCVPYFVEKKKDFFFNSNLIKSRL